MRDLFVQEYPSFYPNRCTRCGVGAGDSRKYFVDLGLNLDLLYNPLQEGNIYYCNECAKNLVIDLQRVMAQWESEPAPWTSTYEWEKDFVDGDGDGTTTEDSGASSADDSDTESDDHSIEPSELDATTADAVPESTVPDSSTDDDKLSTAGFDFGA